MSHFNNTTNVIYSDDLFEGSKKSTISRFLKKVNKFLKRVALTKNTKANFLMSKLLGCREKQGLTTHEEMKTNLLKELRENIHELLKEQEVLNTLLEQNKELNRKASISSTNLLQCSSGLGYVTTTTEICSEEYTLSPGNEAEIISDKILAEIEDFERFIRSHSS